MQRHPAGFVCFRAPRQRPGLRFVETHRGETPSRRIIPLRDLTRRLLARREQPPSTSLEGCAASACRARSPLPSAAPAAWPTAPPPGQHLPGAGRHLPCPVPPPRQPTALGRAPRFPQHPAAWLAARGAGTCSPPWAGKPAVPTPQAFPTTTQAHTPGFCFPEAPP